MGAMVTISNSGVVQIEEESRAIRNVPEQLMAVNLLATDFFFKF